MLNALPMLLLFLAASAQDEPRTDGADEAASDAAAAELLGLLAQPQEDLDAGLQQGWNDEPGRFAYDPAAVTSLEPVEPAFPSGRPHRRLDPDEITCPPDALRQTERASGEHTLTWCALPDGRKKGPELLVYAGGGQRMYTEYLLDQEHGEHVITEADGRVMVLGRFELGREEGEWQSWYIGGDRASRGEYHAGKKIGIWSEWSRDGEESRCDYRDPAVPDIQCVAPKD